MAATLIRTLYDLQTQSIQATVRLVVQGERHEFVVNVPEPELLLLAAASERPDWNTADVAAAATAIAGLTVNVYPET